MAATEDPYTVHRRGAIRIIEGWEANFSSASGEITLHAEPRGQRKPFRLDPRETTFLLGHAAKVITLAGTILDLLDQERVVEAIPLVRVSYESALTAQWVSLLKLDAAKALVNEYVRQRRALQQDVRAVQNLSLAAYADDIADVDMEWLETASAEQARRIHLMMRDLEYGEEMYVYYRLMSEYSHAGVSAVDLFFEKAPEEDQLPVFNYEPKQPGRAMWSYFTLMCLCQAVHPVARLLSDRSLFTEIESLARQHGFHVRLKRSRHWYERKHKRQSRR